MRPGVRVAGVALGIIAGLGLGGPSAFAQEVATSKLEGVRTVPDAKVDLTRRGDGRHGLFTPGEFTYLASTPGTYVRLTRLNDRLTYVEHLRSASGRVTWSGALRVVARK